MRRDRWETAFLEEYRRWGNLAQAARLAEVNVDTVRRHRKSDPEFAAKIAEAHEQFVDDIETDLVKLGRTKNNVIALIARLKAERPGKYHDKLQVDAAVKQLNVHAVGSIEDAQKLLAQMLADSTDVTKAALAGEVIDVPALPPAERQPQ